jgi:magnesium chelatase accessory protein
MSDAPRWNVEGRDWPLRQHSRFVEAGGLRWHVQMLGAGPVVLLLHGTGAATHSWRDLAPLLAHGFTVVAPDLPGHAFTSAARHGARSLPGYARLVGALLAALGVTPALVVGHSAGAAIALRMALDGHLAPTAPIVSLNGALLPFPGPAARLFPALAKLLFDNPLAPRLFAFQAVLPGQVSGFLDRSTGSRLDATGVDLYARLFRMPGHCAGALAMMAGWDLASLERDLPRLANPVTLVAASGDLSVPPSVSERVARLVRQGRLVSQRGLGHLSHEEAPERTAELVEESWALADAAAALPEGKEQA